MNLPNLLSLSRVIVVIPLVMVLVTSVSEYLFGAPRFLIGGIIFLLAGLTDLFDGWLARKWKQVTATGNLLDTIADKIFISVPLIALVENRLAPSWVVGIVVAREFVVMGLKASSAHNGTLIAPSLAGKAKMWAQTAAVFLLIVSLSPTGGPPQLSNFGKPFPDLQFWNIAEVSEALQHLFGLQNTTWNDWQVLTYTAGRAMLWVVVTLSLYSMIQYVVRYCKKPSS